MASLALKSAAALAALIFSTASDSPNSREVPIENPLFRYENLDQPMIDEGVYILPDMLGPRAWEDFAREVHRVDRVWVGTKGGRPEYARKIGELIREHAIEVVVGWECLSACMHHILPAARQITVTHNAVIAFHGTPHLYVEMLDTPIIRSALADPALGAGAAALINATREDGAEFEREWSHAGLDPALFQCADRLLGAQPLGIERDDWLTRAMGRPDIILGTAHTFIAVSPGLLVQAGFPVTVIPPTAADLMLAEMMADRRRYGEARMVSFRPCLLEDNPP
jgi:hypothetical protein